VHPTDDAVCVDENMADELCGVGRQDRMIGVPHVEAVLGVEDCVRLHGLHLPGDFAGGIDASRHEFSMVA